MNKTITQILNERHARKQELISYETMEAMATTVKEDKYQTIKGIEGYYNNMTASQIDKAHKQLVAELEA